MITVFAPAGIGEITPETDLVDTILAAVEADPSGPLADGDVLVVTSKIISKHEGRIVPATEVTAAKAAETVRTVARRGPVGIVQSRLGIVQAAAGVDNSNVDPAWVLLLPLDPDASAERLLAGLVERTGLRLGVVVSDTAGRAWRLGQTDHAIGAAGVRVLNSYEGQTDAYGNDLQVTAMALADELASAADLVKSKLSGRPVAVVRGMPSALHDPSDASGPSDEFDPSDEFGGQPTGARALLRDASQDMFALGAREAVLAAVLAALGRTAEFEDLVAIEDPESLTESVLAGFEPNDPVAQTLRRVLQAAGSTPAD